MLPPNRLWPALIIVALLGSPTAVLLVAEAPSREQDLKNKEAEVLRLKEQLRQHEIELERLRTENERLRQEKAAAPAPRTQPGRGPSAPPPPSQPLPGVPVPTPDTVVTTDDLVAYFATDATQAAARFAGREFVIRGTVDRFLGRMMQRKLDLVFTSPGGDLVVRAVVGLPTSWDGVLPGRDGASLIKRDERGTKTLLKRGAEVRVRGRCKGLAGSEIEFDRAELLLQLH